MKYVLTAIWVVIFFQAEICSAQDDVDVRGGIFSKEQINRDMFAPSSGSASSADAEVEEETVVDNSDSFVVPEQQKAQQPKARISNDEFEDAFADDEDQTVSAPTTTTPPATVIPAQQDVQANQPTQPGQTVDAVTRAASVIEQIKTMNQAMPDLKTLNNAIEQAGGAGYNAPLDAPQLPMNNAPAVTAALPPANEAIPGPAKISLIVNGADRLHLEQNLERLALVRSRFGVQVQEVVLAGIADYQLEQMKHLALPADELPEQPKTAGKLRKSAFPRRTQDLIKLYQRRSSDELMALQDLEFSPAGQSKIDSMTEAELQASLSGKSDKELRKEFLSKEQQEFFNTVNQMSDRERDEINNLSREYILEDMKSNRELPNSLKQFAEMNMLPSTATDVERRLQELGASSSPVWIIHAGGKRYVFEGGYDPRDMFNPAGEFLPPRPGF